MPTNSDIKSPFFHRNYGGYTLQQKEFYQSVIKSQTGKIILDPMGGQGFFLSEMSRNKYDVWLGDMNPAPLLLACLRDPIFILHRDDIYKYIERFLLDNFSPQMDRENLRYKYEDGWIAEPIKNDLEKYAYLIGKDKLVSILSGGVFFSIDIFTKFAACLPVLAARELTTYHESDNKTWLMPGGLLRETGIYLPLKKALDSWYQNATEIANDVDNSNEKSWGSFNVSYMNVEQGDFGGSPNPDVIITSPPYANRLDYTRMWYPEMVICSIIFSNLDIKQIKNNLVGSTVVANKKISREDLQILPVKTQETLEEIRTDTTSRASESYYYPFFANYALSLTKSISSICPILKNGGYLVVFIRDTVRKDVLFSASELIESILQDNYKFSLIKTNNEIIRSHVGLIRFKNRKPSVYGMVQREWWLVFKKG